MPCENDVVGIIPAAGYARRVSPLPCSKEIYPIMHPDGTSRVAASYLLDSFKNANIEKIYLVLREGKWDIPAYFKDGTSTGLNLAYIVSEATGGVPQTVDKAYPFIKEKRVAFGFPDILIQPSNIFRQLFEKQVKDGADLVLGLFEATDPQKMDMVEFNSEAVLKDIVIKPNKTDLKQTWIVAIWTPVFSRFLHDFVSVRDKSIGKSTRGEELYLGDIFREAMQNGITTSYQKFDGRYLDIGTPEALRKVNSLRWISSFESK